MLLLQAREKEPQVGAMSAGYSGYIPGKRDIWVALCVVIILSLCFVISLMDLYFDCFFYGKPIALPRSLTKKKRL